MPVTGCTLRVTTLEVRQIRMALRFPLRRLLLALLLVTACAQVPVQEMSDARQALQAARAVAEGPGDLARLDTAGRLLREAEAALEAGRYADARRLANAARVGANEVREAAAGSR